MTSPINADAWPWLALVALGLFHGINPAMGWLFAVALGLHRGSQRVVYLSLVPMAIGHAASVAVVAMVVITFGVALDAHALTRSAGVLLLLFAAWHYADGHRRRLRVGMQTGLAGLLLWSFMMASAHGAGLMVVPLLGPICGAAGPNGAAIGGSASTALAVVALHTGAMFAATAAASAVAYHWVGLAFLRRGWVNFDLLWTIALVVSGAALLLR
jgi:hypothetical protein